MSTRSGKPIALDAGKSGPKSACSSTSRATCAPDAGTSTSCRPRRESRAVEPTCPAQHGPHTLLEQHALEELDLGLVLRAGGIDEVAPPRAAA
jgi:hypothetical protein